MSPITGSNCRLSFVSVFHVTNVNPLLFLHLCILLLPPALIPKSIFITRTLPTIQPLSLMNPKRSFEHNKEMYLLILMIADKWTRITESDDELCVRCS